jgi:hypothetical protein
MLESLDRAGPPVGFIPCSLTAGTGPALVGTMGGSPPQRGRGSENREPR